MGKRSALPLLGLALGVLAGCTGLVPRVDAQVIAQAQARGVAADPDRLTAGRDLYVRRCGSCHSLHATAHADAAEWADALRTMAPKAKIDAAQTALILDYLRATCR